MKWMSNDYREERGQKKTFARRLGKAMEQHRATRVERAKRERAKEERALRRTARRMAHCVTKFWQKVDKIVVYKHRMILDAKKRVAMDRHLAFLVGQTERYHAVMAAKGPADAAKHKRQQEESTLAVGAGAGAGRGEEKTEPSGGTGATYDADMDDVAAEETAGAGAGAGSGEPPKPEPAELTLSLVAGSDTEGSPTRHTRSGIAGDKDDPYEFNEAEAADDEETLAAQEAVEAAAGEQGAALKQAEEAVLQEEATMPIEELMARHGVVASPTAPAAGGRPAKRRRSPVNPTLEALEGDDVDATADSEYEASDEGDDEATLQAQEETEAVTGVDNRAEENDLKAEAEMPIEELMARYGGSAYLNEPGGSDAPDSSPRTEDGVTDGAPPAKTRASADTGGVGAAAMLDEPMEDGSADEEFSAESEADDEATLEAEEARQRKSAADAKAEEDELAAEADMPIEELLRRYGAGAAEEEGDDGSDGGDDGSPSGAGAGAGGGAGVAEAKGIATPRPRRGQQRSSDVDDIDDEFVPDDENDDEATLEAEEARERRTAADTKAEEDDLAEEANMPIEELMKKYGVDAAAAGSEPESDAPPAKRTRRASSTSEPGDNRDGGLAALLEDADEPTEPQVASSNRGAAEEQHEHFSVEPSFLLRDDPNMKLRSYQRHGLDWLVALHEGRLNGILADEMGLGKTIQTISLLAYLASNKCVWGPHLIVVPTSTLLNWEMEFKRWCPALKVVAYYGTTKQRKEKRVGWSNPNTFHVVITSYQLVVQDASIFRRKKWYYMILDEAHYIKNFQSLRWQTLLKFSTRRRLLLTGTPLQNSLMELWSLMHFLMPHLFRSQAEFRHWFSTPLTASVEGGTTINRGLVKRLHAVLRPFVLRRLKLEVENQMPKKYEHVVPCPLSKRQQFLYEDFISRASTRKALASGSYMGMMNVLMQLRKVCNHPDLFEPRLIVSPLVAPRIELALPSMIARLPGACGLTRFGDSQDSPWALSLRAINLDLVAAESTTRRSALDAFEIRTPTALILGAVNDSLIDAFPPPYPFGSEEERNAVLEELNSLPTEEQLLSESLMSLSRSFVLFHAGLRVRRRHAITHRLEYAASVSERRCEAAPLYGQDLRLAVAVPGSAADVVIRQSERPSCWPLYTNALRSSVRSREERFQQLLPVIQRCCFAVPAVMAEAPAVVRSGPVPSHVLQYDKRVTELVRRAKSAAAPYHDANIRLRIAFPDKRLVQVDCGKFTIMAEMLWNLKRGGHRCLIFTQMTKMLDVLEEFLNLHGHTYFRLDGATGVEKRQKLMDQFNTDERIFAFILSTRSGGLGINLTGADTVIFYDSDWNPAMDAQAQDRAHRIGQTRDVHIYRLISEQTVEENILLKANQKRELNKLSLEDGNFTTTNIIQGSDIQDIMAGAGVTASATDEANKDGSPEEAEGDADKDEKGDRTSKPNDVNAASAQEIAAAMAAVEDESDVVAGQRAAQEAALEQREFDETAPVAAAEATPAEADAGAPAADGAVAKATKGAAKPKGKVKKGGKKKAAGKKGKRGAAAAADDDDESDDGPVSDGEADAEEALKVFAAAAERVGEDMYEDTMGSGAALAASVANRAAERDASAAESAGGRAAQEFRRLVKGVERRLEEVEAQLSGVDRYALRFRQVVNPHELVRPEVLQDAERSFALEEEEWEIDQIEAMREEEDARALADAEMLAVGGTEGEEGGVLGGIRVAREMYRRAVAAVRRERRRRELTGENWVAKQDPVQKLPYYFNVDTRQAQWLRPKVLADMDAVVVADAIGWGGLMPVVLAHVAAFLVPYPDRVAAMQVCRRWAVGCTHPGLFLWVEAPPPPMPGMAAQSADAAGATGAPRRMTRHAARMAEQRRAIGLRDSVPPFVSIPAAVAAASPGATIALAPGAYFEPTPLEVRKHARFVTAELDSELSMWRAVDSRVNAADAAIAAAVLTVRHGGDRAAAASAAQSAALASLLVPRALEKLRGAASTKALSMLIPASVIKAAQTSKKGGAGHGAGGDDTAMRASMLAAAEDAIVRYTLSDGMSLSGGLVSRARNVPDRAVVRLEGPVVTRDEARVMLAGMSIRNVLKTTRLGIDVGEGGRLTMVGSDVSNRGGIGAAVYLGRSAHGNFDDCRFTSGEGASGLVVSGFAGAVVENCEFVDCDAAGVALLSAGSAVVDKCVFRGCAATCLRLHSGAGAQLVDSDVTGNRRKPRAGATLGSPVPPLDISPRRAVFGVQWTASGEDAAKVGADDAGAGAAAGTRGHRRKKRRGAEGDGDDGGVRFVFTTPRPVTPKVAAKRKLSTASPDGAAATAAGAARDGGEHGQGGAAGEVGGTGSGEKRGTRPSKRMREESSGP